METSFKCLHKAKHRDDVSKSREIQDQGWISEGINFTTLVSDSTFPLCSK